MTTGQYRDLIDAVSRTWSSCRSAATDSELEHECTRLEAVRRELEEAVCPRASSRDKSRVNRLLTDTRQYLFSARMYLYDNQRIEAEYL